MLLPEQCKLFPWQQYVLLQVACGAVVCAVGAMPCSSDVNTGISVPTASRTASKQDQCQNRKADSSFWRIWTELLCVSDRKSQIATVAIRRLGSQGFATSLETERGHYGKVLLISRMPEFPGISKTKTSGVWSALLGIPNSKESLTLFSREGALFQS